MVEVFGEYTCDRRIRRPRPRRCSGVINYGGVMTYDRHLSDRGWMNGGGGAGRGDLSSESDDLSSNPPSNQKPLAKPRPETPLDNPIPAFVREARGSNILKGLD